jgi:WD40 repeat protein
MPDVFISYSRKDKHFVQRLHAELTLQNRDTWVDWEDIQYAEDWWQKICVGIQSADNFVFVITPESVRSKICFDEIEYATQQKKRIVPILRLDVTDDVDKQRMHSAINRHNWLPFREMDDFGTSFEKLINTIQLNPEYVQMHTRLILRAAEWEQRLRKPSLLLRGDDLQAAENWLIEAVNKQPSPTTLQAEYIANSRRAETYRGRALMGGVSLALAITVALAALAFGLFRQSEERRIEADHNAEMAQNNASTAVYNESVSKAIALASQAQTDISSGQRDRSVLLGLQSLVHYPYSVQAERALGQAVLDFRLQMVIPNQSILSGASFLAWSPDGSRFLKALKISSSGTFPSGISIWNITGEFEQTLTLEVSQEIVNVMWSRDGKSVWVIDGSATMSKTDLATSTVETWQILADTKIRAAAWTPDGSQVAVADESTVSIYDVASHRHLLSLKENIPFIYSMVWSPDSAYLLITGSGNVSGIWETTTGNKIMNLSPGGALVAWSPDSKRAVISSNSAAYVWDVEANTALFSLADHRDSIAGIGFSPDGQYLMGASADKTIKIWDAYGGYEVLTINGSSAFNAAMWSPDGTQILTSDIDSIAKIWDARINIQPVTIQSGWAGYGLERPIWSPDGSRFLTSVDQTSVGHIWDTATGEKLITLKDDFQVMLAGATWSPDGTHILTLDQTGSGKIWDTNTGEVIRTTLQLQTDIYQAFWSPTQNYLVTLDRQPNEDIRFDAVLREAETGLELLRIPDILPNTISWSPDGKQFAVGFYHELQIWDASQKNKRWSMGAHWGGIQSTMWSPDGNYLASSGWDTTTKIWNTTTGTLEMTLNKQASYSSSWSPNGERIVTSGGTNDFIIWDSRTGNELLTLPGFQEGVIAVSWSPDNRHILITNLDGPFQIWNLWQSTAELIMYAQNCCVKRELTSDELQQLGLN